MAKEAGNTMDISKTYSNGRGRMNECSSGQKPPVRAGRQRRENEEKLLCNGDG